MRLIVVGAPDAGKSKLVRAIKRENKLKFDDGMSGLDKKDLALGLLADYRTELKLAADRMMAIASAESALFTHTLIDSLAYSSLRVISMKENGGISEDTFVKWSILTVLIGQMLKDTLKYDYIFFLPGGERSIEVLLEGTLDAFGAQYTTLKGSPKDQATDVLNQIKNNE